MRLIETVHIAATLSIQSSLLSQTLNAILHITILTMVQEKTRECFSNVSKLHNTYFMHLRFFCKALWKL